MAFLWISLIMIVAGSISGWSTDSQTVLRTLPKASPTNHQDFGVGFDLTVSYGTAAVSFHNGSTVAVAKVEVSENYKEVFRRLSLTSSEHPSPPYTNTRDYWIDLPRQISRKYRKAVGLPASSDVAYLADALSSLRAQVESNMRQPISSAGVSTQHLNALYTEDLRDAYDYIGLEYLAFPVTYEILYESSAAYAGYGYGLCSNFTDRGACRREEQDMKSEVVMVVLFTRNVLTVSLSILKSAYILYEPRERHVNNFTLGYNDIFDDDDWRALGAQLENVFEENPLYEAPTKVLLMGDCTQNNPFMEILKISLRNQVGYVPEILWKGAESVAVRGTAEMAKRLLWDHYKI
ncbi:hypothetical protein ACLMJK_002921 [Lecanora helva]